MTKRRTVTAAAALAAIIAVVCIGFHLLSRPTWSSDLVTYLNSAESISGEGWRRDGKTVSASMTAEQIDRIFAIIRSADLKDNRDFAGTTDDGGFTLMVDGEPLLIDAMTDAVVQYKRNGEVRQVRVQDEAGKQALRAVLLDVLSEAQ